MTDEEIKLELLKLVAKNVASFSTESIINKAKELELYVLGEKVTSVSQERLD